MNNEEMALKLEGHEHEIGSLKHRVKDLEEQTDTIQQLALSVKELAMNMQSMIKEQERAVKSQERAFQRIEALEKKPSERWNTLITVIITALGSGIITYFLTTLLR